MLLKLVSRFSETIRITKFKKLTYLSPNITSAKLYSNIIKIIVNKLNQIYAQIGVFLEIVQLVSEHSNGAIYCPT